MRFITNCCGKVFRNKHLVTTYLCSHLNKDSLFGPVGVRACCKTPVRKLFTESEKSHQNPNQDSYHALAKTETLYSSNFLRNQLYPETDDEIINQLKSCYDLEDVFRIINSSESPSYQQLNQVVLVLRDLQKLHGHDQHNIPLNDDISQLCDSLSFQKLLASIESNIGKMNANEISCTLLYLNKLNVKCSEPVMMKLINACEKSIFTTEKNLVLQNLSRFFIAIKEENNLWSIYTMSQYLPFLIDALDACDNHDDFRHITVCFQKCVPLLNSDILNKYIAKMDLILQSEDENDDVTVRTRTLLKAIVFLNFKHWSSLYVNEVRRLMAAMKGKVHHLCLTEVSLLHKSIISLQEPFDLSQEIEEVTNNWIQMNQRTNTSIPIFDLQILFPGVKLMNHDDLRTNLIEYLKKERLRHICVLHFNDIHQLIYGSDLKFDRNVTTAYWSMLVNILNTAQTKNAERYVEDVMCCVHRYVHLIGTQKTLRNDFFEKSLVFHIVCVLRDENINCGPAEFSKLALTFLALSTKNPFHLLTDAVLQKLLDNLPRLSFYDNLFVSLVLRIASERFKNRRSGFGQFLRYHVHLNAAANANACKNFQSDPDLTPERLNTALFSYVLTKGIKTSEIFGEICNRFQQVEIDQLHSKIIRDSIFNFNVCDHLVPEYTDILAEYCIKQKNELFGGTVANVLNYCFLFGYTPKKLDEFLAVSTSLIHRDREHLSKSIYLRSALALSYFRELPTSWSEYIFNLKFLEQLDLYMSQLNFKKTNSLRHELMELNRVVCIDYPYREIPWFHEKYCQEIIALERKIPNDFLTSVLTVVKSLIKTDKAIDTNYITPYGHKIDLVLYLNKNGESTTTSDCDPTKLKKIAIILKSNLPSTYYKGKGRLELFSRQLEMLNYEVISLSKQEWNSMYMSNLQEKTNYLRKLIWPA